MSHKLHDEVEEVIHGAEEVIHEAEEMIHDVLEGLSEEEIISHSEHQHFEHAVLRFRNITVALAVGLFLLSMFHFSFSHILKAVAYFLGAAAYFSEFILLTDCFTKRVPHQEMFMAYCFGPLYILLGLSYLMGH